MVDVLLAHSYFLRYDPKQTAKMRPYAPLATLYAASCLRNAGYTVALFDAMLSEGEHEFREALFVHHPRYVVFYEDSFNFLVKMCLGRMREAAQRMSAVARSTGATVIAAGPDVTDHPDLYFPYGVQYAVLGEGEHTLCELLNALCGKDPRPVHEIAGLAYPDKNMPDGVHRTIPRPPERHPDIFPFPAWDLLDVERYRTAWKQAHGYFSLNLVSTRGCPYHCNWCAKPIWGQQYAMRSPSCVAEEMALVKRLLQPDHIWFTDDIFGLRPQWVEDFAREVKERDAVIPFTIQSRADRMTEQAVAGLAKAGCIEVWMGAESGSQKILDAMDKGITVEKIVTARKRLKEAGIRACFFIQFGYPGETFDDIMATVQLVRDTLPDDIGISVSYPLPGTRFYEMVREQLGTKANWDDSGDLAMMFQGTYQSPFYRKLHQLLHRDLELRQRLTDTCGLLPTDILSALDRLLTDWLELGRLEIKHRNANPTRIPLRIGRIESPDLSKEWN
ncbi:MAG TPA: radical SAM protein [Chthonomonadales bacterium]|nr:radical SAM protein [Chthonomonadales bacterium]